MSVTALIAEDEPLLAMSLRAELERAWPGIDVVATVGDGASAVTRTLALQPDVLFLDIRMPGMTGLEAAQALAEEWSEDGYESGKPFPLIVFVTAYDQYALQAFERAAVDYVLKPVQPARLAQTCTRLQSLLQQRSAAPAAAPALGAVVDQLRQLLQAGGLAAVPAIAAPAYLKVIQAALGNTIHMVPIDEVIYFEAADKYVRVVTAAKEHVIRLSLRELQPQLDPELFWQVHRGTVVRCNAIAGAQRDESGKLSLSLRNHPDRLVVSRLYAHLFRGL